MHETLYFFYEVIYCQHCFRKILSTSVMICFNERVAELSKFSASTIFYNAEVFTVKTTFETEVGLVAEVVGACCPL